MTKIEAYKDFGGEIGGEKAIQRRCSIRLSPSPPLNYRQRSRFEGQKLNNLQDIGSGFIRYQNQCLEG
jgi:hypothetical protein